MSAPATSPLRCRIACVRRRLFLQRFVNALIVCWTMALLLSAGWFLMQPHWMPEPPPWLHFVAVGGVLALGVLTALALAWLGAPTALAAALALDERYQLKERVTTSLGMSGSESESAAGRALLDDVNNRLAALRPAERFPIRLPRLAATLPVLALVVLLLALFYHPYRTEVQASEGSKPLTKDPSLKQAIEQKKKDLLNKLDDKAQPRPRDPELKKLDENVAELAHQPTDSKDEAKQFIKDAARAEEAVRDAERQLAARNEAVKERIEQEERLNPDRLTKKKKPGPAKDLEDRMKEGDFQRAADALEELGKRLDPEQQKRLADKLNKVRDKLGDNGLTPEERQRIQKEFDKLKDEVLTEEAKKDMEEALKDLEKVLDALAEPEKQEKQLEDKLAAQRQADEEKAKELAQERKKAEDKAAEAKKKADDAPPDPAERKKAAEEVQKAQQQADEVRKQEKTERRRAEREQEQTRRELEQMKKNNECLNQQAKQDLKDLAKQLGECDQAMKDGKDGEAAKKLRDAQEQMRKMSGDADRQRLLRQLQGLQQAREAVCDAMNGKGQGNGDNASGQGVASGKRPLGQDEDTKHFDTIAPSKLGKGKLRITDFLNGPGGERGARGPSQMTDEIRIQAAQEGASALSRQRLERPSDSDRVRGYFDNMRGPERPPPNK